MKALSSFESIPDDAVPEGYGIPWGLRRFLDDRDLFVHHPETGDFAGLQELWLKISGYAAVRLAEINTGSCPYPSIAIRPQPELLLIAGSRLASNRNPQAARPWLLLLDLKGHRGWSYE